MEANPNYQRAKAWGIRFIEPGKAHTKGGEFIGSEKLRQWLDKAGKSGGTILGAPIRAVSWLSKASERAYDYYINACMLDGFEHGMKFIAASKELGVLTPGLTAKGTIDATIRDVVDHNNKAAGRVKLTGNPDIDHTISGLAFSAQMNWARMSMIGRALNPTRMELGKGGKYRRIIEKDPRRWFFASYSTEASRHYARVQTLQALIGGVAGTIAMTAIANALGEEATVETDPSSSDFLKVRHRFAGCDVLSDEFPGRYPRQLLFLLRCHLGRWC